MNKSLIRSLLIALNAIILLFGENYLSTGQITIRDQNTYMNAGLTLTPFVTSMAIDRWAPNSYRYVLLITLNTFLTTSFIVSFETLKPTSLIGFTGDYLKFLPIHLAFSAKYLVIFLVASLITDLTFLRFSRRN